MGYEVMSNEKYVFLEISVFGSMYAVIYTTTLASKDFPPISWL
jgi:hypothetical protein